MKVISDSRKCYIELPIPPSINKYYATYKGRRLISKEGRNYKLRVARIPLIKIDGRLSVHIKIMAKDKRRRDLDNILKCLLDSLMGAGLYDDDSQIDVLHVTRGEKSKDHKIEVTVFSMNEADSKEIICGESWLEHDKPFIIPTKDEKVKCDG